MAPDTSRLEKFLAILVYQLGEELLVEAEELSANEWEDPSLAALVAARRLLDDILGK